MYDQPWVFKTIVPFPVSFEDLLNIYIEPFIFYKPDIALYSLARTKILKIRFSLHCNVWSIFVCADTL